MKRVMANFDLETNLTADAKECIDALNSEVTKLHNIIAKWGNQIKEHPDNDNLMNNIIDSSSYMQAEIDRMLEHYYTSLYTSKI